MASLVGTEHNSAEGGETVRGVIGKVDEVKKKWLVYEDGNVAQNIQEDEFQYRYGLNRYNRRTARGDVPVAKLVQTSEEKLQKERMMHLQRQREIADQDAEMAKQFHQEQVTKMNQERIGHFQREDEDSILAHQYQKEEMHENAQELEDEKIARELQNKERKKYERRQRERELARECKRLQHDQELALQEAQVRRAGYRNPRSQSQDGELQQGVQHMGLEETPIVDGRVEDTGDFSDFYTTPNQPMADTELQELQRLQDEELARLLQDQEHKRGARANGEKLKEIEENDARLALVMQEQEKLKVAKRRQLRQQRQMSVPERPTPKLTGHPHRSISADHNTHHEDNMANERVMTNGRASYQLEAVDEERSLSRGHYDGHQSQSPSHDLPGTSHTPPPNSVYQGRPLPDTPEGAPSPHLQYPDHAYVTRVNVTGDDEPASPAPPGYTDPPSYRRHKHSAPAQAEDSPAGNMFAAIDPTYYRDRDITDPRPVLEAPPVTTPSHRIPPTEDITPPPPITQATASVGGEDSYCDLDDVGPVQGMKRSTLKGTKKGSKRGGSCKQQ